MAHRKKFRFLALALLSMFLMVACGGKPADTPPSTPDPAPAPSTGGSGSQGNGSSEGADPLAALVEAAKKEGEVVVFSPSKGAMMEMIGKAFTAKYGIKVTNIYAGSTQIMNRVRAEMGNPTGDIWWGSGGIIPFLVAKEEGMLAPYQIQSYDLPETVGAIVTRDKDWHFTGPFLIGLGWAISEDMNPADMPADFRGFLADEWKNEIELSDPAASGTAVAFLMSSVQRFIQEGKTEDEAFEALKELANNVRRFQESGAGPANSVARGEAKVGLAYDQHYLLMAQKAEPVQWHLPKNTMVVIDPMGMIKDAKHPNAAKLYMEFAFSLEAQGIISYNGPHMPVRPDAPVNPIFENTVEDYKESAMELDFDWIQANFDRILQRWRNEIASQK